MNKLHNFRNKTGGRNNQGIQTVFTKSGGAKKKYRFVDFKRNLKDFAFIKRIEKDPYRSAYIALICYSNGALSYIIAVEKLKIGSIISNSSDSLKLGNSILLKNISAGSLISNVELYPGNGSVFARAAGTWVQVIKKFNSIYFQIKLRSGEQRLINSNCMATVGIVSNIYHNQKKLIKAGQTRMLGIKSQVRGICMNPVDHPHGGRTNGGITPKTPWGKLTKGSKTRKNKKNLQFIIINRKKNV